MSIIRADSIKNRAGDGAPDFPNGITVTGVVTSTVLDTSVSTLNVTGGHVNVGSNIQLGDAGIVTATSFVGNISGTTGTFSGAVSGSTGTFTGNVSVGGTLTYEDVTNIDSVGLITARKGIVSSGVVTATAFDGNIKVIASNSAAATVYPLFAGFGATQSGFLELKTDNSLTYNSLSGELTAVKFTGDGSSLTSLPAATPTTSDIQIVYEITNQTSFSYFRFAGNGVDSSANNPDLYLQRGKKYRFINNSGGIHPFRIQSDNGSTLYSTGVTNNNSSSGNIDFAIRWDAPPQLYYKCGNHPSMLGNIYLMDGKYDTKAHQVGCAVRMSSNFSHPGSVSFNSGTSWVIPFDTEVWDIGSNFNTSNYTFTAPVTGRYLCCYTIQYEDITNWVWTYFYPVVTGTGGTNNVDASYNAGIVMSDAGGSGVSGGTSTTAKYQTFANTVIINLTAGQAVRMGARGVISATIKGSTETQWTMQLIG